jgi:lysophospholipase L1-like esterase
MPLGDSITYGYGSSDLGGYREPLFSAAYEAGQQITFVGSVTSGPATVDGVPFPQGNEGHEGYMIDPDSEGYSGIEPLTGPAIATYRPNIILLMIGTNDCIQDNDGADAPTRLGALIDEIVADAPDALLVVATIPAEYEPGPYPSVPRYQGESTRVLAYDAAIPGVVQARASQGKHVKLVDIYSALGPWSDQWHPDEAGVGLFSDWWHPNDAGYALMGAAWYQAIEGYLRKTQEAGRDALP